MRLLLSHELRLARAAFDRDGRIPYINASRLIELGVIVPELEDQWARGLR